MADPQRDELAAIADREARAARASASRAVAREKDEAGRKARDAEARRRDDAVAPTGFTSSMAAFWLFGLLLVVGVTAVVGLFESWSPLMWRVIAIAGALVTAAIAIAWVDALTWRNRLPFALEGLDRIDGRSTIDTFHASFVAFRVEIVFPPEHEGRVRDAARSALEILASRVNAMMTSDEEYGFKEEQAWRVDETLVAHGEASLAIYTTRVLEHWLRREMRLVRPPAGTRVLISARYSDRTFWVSRT